MPSIPVATRRGDTAIKASVEGVLTIGMRAPWIVVGLGIVWLALFNLTRFPATWFDEGSHLHVPKTLVTYGKYADYSDGEFRYYGPTVGVGPTVMVPIAAAFKIAGVGLLQARVVMSVYLLLAVVAFIALARRVGNTGTAAFATFLLLTSPSIGLLENGRQVLGEVPGLFFLCAGLACWFATWDRPTWAGLIGASLLMALASITKHVYLISLLPGLVAAAALNFAYYRRHPLKVFAIPIVTVGAAFGAWQLVLIAGLGPGTAAENLRLLQDATRGAALVFSTENMRRAGAELVSIRAIAGWVVPGLIFTGVRQFSRSLEEQRWGAVWWMALANLAWYVLASAGWPRYAFAGLALSCLMVGRLAWELAFSQDLGPARTNAWTLRGLTAFKSGGLVVALWLGVVSAGFLGRTAVRIASAPYPSAQRMAEYLNANVDKNLPIHSWEPEMSILTDHRYRFPPPQLLIVAVAHQWTGGPPVTAAYDFERGASPDYVLEGPFSKYVGLYPPDRLARAYQLVKVEGGYSLYERRSISQ